jgi:hypothetical protein
MQKDERDLLEVLKFELNFLEKGGYGRSTRESWRPVFIFEDSPTCMNYDCKTNPAPCSDCVLMQLVPPELRLGKLACRQIPLNAAGETLDSLYRWGDEHEIEETLRNWLVTTITQLEERQASSQPAVGERAPAAASEITKGIALHQNAHPKCANPACPTSFHWLQGGKFFRFRSEDGARELNSDAIATKSNKPGAKHFWLCEHCSHIFTLVYDGETGVVLKLLWLGDSLDEISKKLPNTQRN